jgi:hypothetical protein
MRESVPHTAALDGPTPQSGSVYVGPFSGVPEVRIEQIGGAWYAIASERDVSTVSMHIMPWVEQRENDAAAASET